MGSCYVIKLVDMANLRQKLTQSVNRQSCDSKETWAVRFENLDVFLFLHKPVLLLMLSL